MSVEIPKLKVVTLNFWGIRYLSKDVDFRLNHLIKAINENDYDIIALQEIWSQTDFSKIKSLVNSNYPYSHYFESGFVGSGCCFFSKHQIQDVFYHKFSLNGYPYKINHSDWFAGKLVGLATIKYHSILINLYVTHLHANYSANFHKDPFLDEYLSHRISQLYELGQFVAKTSKTSELTLVLGDLNTCDFEVGYKMLRNHAGLLDAFKEKPKTEMSEFDFGATCNTKSNIYSTNSSEMRSSFPNGQRIDYIMYKHRDEIDVNCVECKTCFGKINNSKLNYSDHEGVYAEFEIMTNLTDDYKRVLIKDKLEPDITYYLEAKTIIEKSIHSISFSQFLFYSISFLCVLSMIMFNDLLNENLILFKNFLLTFLFFYSFFHALFIKSVEKKHLKTTLHSINFAINLFVMKYKIAKLNKIL